MIKIHTIIRSKRRALTAHEIELWSQVTKLIKPLRHMPSLPPPAEVVAPASVKPTASAVPAPKRREPKTSLPIEPREAALVPLERRVRQRLARGLTSVDDAIDLHGLYQDEAHAALRRFLFRAHAGGARIVLVVTGKGRSNGETSLEERGVLRRNVPHWLRAADLRTIVLAFEEAGQRHGGAGALYVRLRAARA